MQTSNVNRFNADEKILKYPDKLDYFFNGHKTLIVTELDLTNRCNNRCPDCTGVKQNGAELSREQIVRIADGLAAMDNKGVILSGGGEPLIHPFFSEALDLLLKRGMKVGLNSNGLALTPELGEHIAANCTYFRISLDAATPELYRKTHGMPAEAFEATLRNIRLFSEIKKRRRSTVSFGLGFLTSRNTAHEMEPFVELSRNIGADFAQFRPFTGDVFNVTDEYHRLKEKYETDEFKVGASTQKYNMMGIGGKRDYDRCSGMFFSTVITADAKMFACLHHRQNEKYFIGRIDENNSIEDIFRSPLIRAVYQRTCGDDCPFMCRNDIFNRTLNALALDVTHREFL